MTNQRWWLIPLLCVLVWGGIKLYKIPDQKQGVLAQDFIGYLPNGDSLQLSNYKGQFVLLNFWGSWCGPCRQHNKSLVKLYNKYKNVSFQHADQLSIISVGIETNKRAWLAAIQKDGLEWSNHVSDIKRLEDHVAKLYGIREIPATFLIDEKGLVVAVNPTEKEMNNWLAKRQINTASPQAK